MWQDLVLTGGAFFFSLALLPTLRDKNAQVPRSSSITTCVILILYAITHYTLDLVFAASTALITATMWLLIAIYRPKKATP